VAVSTTPKHAKPKSSDTTRKGQHTRVSELTRPQTRFLQKDYTTTSSIPSHFRSTTWLRSGEKNKFMEREYRGINSKILKRKNTVSTGVDPYLLELK